MHICGTVHFPKQLAGTLHYNNAIDHNIFVFNLISRVFASILVLDCCFIFICLSLMYVQMARRTCEMCSLCFTKVTLICSYIGCLRYL